jgi:hypothetical protein
MSYCSCRGKKEDHSIQQLVNSSESSRRTHLIPNDAERVLAGVVGGHAPAFVALLETLTLPHSPQTIVLNLAQALDLGPRRVGPRVLVRAEQRRGGGGGVSVRLGHTKRR